MKINLGCGRWRIDGFVNVDAVMTDEVKPDVMADALTFLKQQETGTVEFIYAGHFIEHLPKEKAQNLLRECVRVMKPGAKMQIVVPDTKKALDLLEKNRLNMKIDDVVLGDRSNDFEYHRQVFTAAILIDMCEWHFEEVKEIHESPYWVADVGWQTTVECTKH